MSTTPSIEARIFYNTPSHPCATADVKVGHVYLTRIETGDVLARVTEIVPSNRVSRKTLFHAVDVSTGRCLPRLKRADDFFTIHSRATRSNPVF